jgi:hypothetical protein
MKDSLWFVFEFGNSNLYLFYSQLKKNGLENPMSTWHLLILLVMEPF